MEIYWLALGTLAVWRLTHLLQAEQGPWAAVGTLRHWAEGRLGGEPFKCFYCVSLWVALPLALLLGRHWGGGCCFGRPCLPARSWWRV